MSTYAMMSDEPPNARKRSNNRIATSDSTLLRQPAMRRPAISGGDPADGLEFASPFDQAAV